MILIRNTWLLLLGFTLTLGSLTPTHAGLFQKRSSRSKSTSAKPPAAPLPKPLPQKRHLSQTVIFPKDPTRELEFADPDALAFSPDGRRLVGIGNNASKESVLKSWNTATWAKEREVRSQTSARQLDFTSDQRRLVLISGKDDKVWLLDPMTLQVQSALTASGTVISFTISPDGKTLATVSSSDWKIQLWNLDTQSVSRTLSGQSDLTTCIVYSPDGKYLASTGKQIRVWNLGTGAVEKTLTKDADYFSSFFACFSPDNTKLAASCNDGKTRVWDVATGQVLESFESKQKNVFSVRFSPNGRTLITRSMSIGSDATSNFLAILEGSKLCIWDLATRSMVELSSDVSIMMTHSFAFSPDGRTIVATRNKSIGIWTGSEKN